MKTFPILYLQSGGVAGPLDIPPYMGGALWMDALSQFGKNIKRDLTEKAQKDPKKPQQPQKKPPAKGTDSVHVMATPGEHVMNLGAVAIAGRHFLDYLNHLGLQHPVMQQHGDATAGADEYQEGGAINQRKKMFPVVYAEEGIHLPDGWSATTPGDVWGPDWNQYTGFPDPGLLPDFLQPPGTPPMNVPLSAPPGLPDLPSNPSVGSPFVSPGGFPGLGGPSAGPMYESPEFRQRLMRQFHHLQFGRHPRFSPFGPPRSISQVEPARQFQPRRARRVTG